MSRLDEEKVKKTKRTIRSEKEAAFTEEVQLISTAIDEKARRLFECAREKGASAWLSALPLKRLGYVINKQEFRDAVSLIWMANFRNTSALWMWKNKFL